jgi:hypothetical protein
VTDADFYLLEQLLRPDDRQVLLRVREFMEKSVEHESSVNPLRRSSTLGVLFVLA